jgi:hypothetical protein
MMRLNFQDSRSARKDGQREASANEIGFDLQNDVLWAIALKKHALPITK